MTSIRPSEVLKVKCSGGRVEQHQKDGSSHQQMAWLVGFPVSKCSVACTLGGGEEGLPVTAECQWRFRVTH